MAHVNGRSWKQGLLGATCYSNFSLQGTWLETFSILFSYFASNTIKVTAYMRLRTFHLRLYRHMHAQLVSWDFVSQEI